MAFQALAETITLAGHITSVDETDHSFTIRTRSNDNVRVYVGPTTNYEVMTNIDGISRNRMVQSPNGAAEGTTDEIVRALRPYIIPDTFIYVSGLHQEDGDHERFEARTIYLLQSTGGGKLVFEETHWWLNQISRMADRWLDELFDARRDYSVDDFSRLYRTNLNITGHPSENDPNVQECATLSRLIYGLSSAFLLTGEKRYYMAAKAAVDYHRQAFRSLSSDGTHAFWASGRRRSGAGETLMFASDNGDDKDTIPLYEQIYAIAGLAQFYRITADWEVLEDIRRTLNTFDDFFRDSPEAAARGFLGHGGYYTHLDPVTMRPDTPQLGQNQSRKNWNSIGDHIPAYLVNLVCALDPVPHGTGMAGFEELRDRCVNMLDYLVTLILEKFPDEKSDYVNERFHADWTPDHTYSWQQNRAVVGHNLKIAWNLSRCAVNMRFRAELLRDHGRRDEADALEHKAGQCVDLATRLGDRMAAVGVDALRGGLFDCVERNPMNGMPIEFAWGSTKDFWQQEQGVLAYLMLHAVTGRPDHLQMARECAAFWNLFFLDRDRQGIFFRTTEGGLPVIQGMYGQKGSHAMAGYHSFELNYLAHLYMRSYVDQSEDDRRFCLHFHVLCNREQQSINVLPDFVPPNHIGIESVRVNGVDRTESLKPEAPNDFQIRLDGIEGDPADGSIDLLVEFVVH